MQATFGQGEETDNAREFYKWLFADEREQEVEKNKMKDMQFAVFGLGIIICADLQIVAKFFSLTSCGGSPSKV